jgi:hypothetical protein
MDELRRTFRDFCAIGKQEEGGGAERTPCGEAPGDIRVVLVAIGGPTSRRTALPPQRRHCRAQRAGARRAGGGEQADVDGRKLALLNGVRLCGVRLVGSQRSGGCHGDCASCIADPSCILPSCIVGCLGS